MSTALFTVLPDPDLSFGPVKKPDADERHDPQKGLLTHGPYSLQLGSPWHPPQVRLYPIAAESDWGACIDGVKRLHDFERQPKHSAYLRADFPGFEQAFHSKLKIEVNAAKQRIPDGDLQMALDASSAATGFQQVLKLCEDAIEKLGVIGRSDVVVLQLPTTIIERFRRLDPEFRPLQPKDPRRDKRQMMLFEELLGDDNSGEEETLFHDLRRSLKVLAMRRKVALQLITANFLSEDEQNPWAYKLWNISTSLFCKAGGIPWRLRTGEDVAYCGIRFGISKGRGQQSILVGLAQLVNAKGQLVAVKAGQATRSKSRSEAGYYLTKEQARSLIAGALADFELVVGKLPERVVVHKSSPFKWPEIAGMQEAASGIRDLDLIFLKGKTTLRLLPERGQPADRGSMVPTSETSALLYTTGHVPQFEKYRGLHVPHPVELIVAKSSRPLRSLATDVLRLTKMNWNSTLFETRLPCTFDNATEMIGMMKELRDNESLDPDIRYYI